MRGKPGTRSRRSPTTDERRRAILDAAVRIFARKGYRMTDVQMVADAAGVGKGTVYRHFGAKRELFAAAVGASMEDIKAKIEQDIAHTDDPVEVIKTVVKACLAYYDANPDAAELIIHERSEFGDGPGLTYLAWRRRYAPQLARRVRQAVERGMARNVAPRAVAEFLSDLLFGVILARKIERRGPKLALRARGICDILLRGILKHEPGRRGSGSSGVKGVRGARR
jgi:AcrR family transcriptional regulator